MSKMQSTTTTRITTLTNIEQKRSTI